MTESTAFRVPLVFLRLCDLASARDRHFIVLSDASRNFAKAARSPSRNSCCGKLAVAVAVGDAHEPLDRLAKRVGHFFRIELCRPPFSSNWANSLAGLLRIAQLSQWHRLVLESVGRLRPRDFSSFASSAFTSIPSRSTYRPATADSAGPPRLSSCRSSRTVAVVVQPLEHHLETRPQLLAAPHPFRSERCGSCPSSAAGSERRWPAALWPAPWPRSAFPAGGHQRREKLRRATETWS